jgi:hypothetical protein
LLYVAHARLGYLPASAFLVLGIAGVYYHIQIKILFKWVYGFELKKANF